MKLSPKFFKPIFLKQQDKAGAGTIVGIVAAVILVSAIILAYLYYSHQIGGFGLGFVGSVIGFFDSIPQDATNFGTSVSNAFTNGVTGWINSFFSYIQNHATSSFGSALKTIENFFGGLAKRIGLEIMPGRWYSWASYQVFSS